MKLMPFIGWNELDPLSRDALTSVFLGISCSLNNNAHEMGKTILQQNALILVPSGESDDHVVPLREHWLLVDGNRISKIAPQVTPPSAETLVIDCAGRIISPGFVDTHHHLWQTQLKARHANHTLLEFMPSG